MPRLPADYHTQSLAAIASVFFLTHSLRKQLSHTRSIHGLPCLYTETSTALRFGFNSLHKAIPVPFFIPRAEQEFLKPYEWWVGGGVRPPSLEAMCGTPPRHSVAGHAVHVGVARKPCLVRQRGPCPGRVRRGRSPRRARTAAEAGDQAVVSVLLWEIAPN